MPSHEPDRLYCSQPNHDVYTHGNEDDLAETSRLQREEFDIEEPPEFHSSTSSFGRRPLEKFFQWMKGPKPSTRQLIKPWRPSLHRSLSSLQNHYAPTRKSKILLLVVFHMLWAAMFWSAVIHWKNAPQRNQPDYGMPIRQLDCGSTLWESRNGCGLDGELCGPFNGSFAFRCPTGCRGYRLLNPRAVGIQEINYQPLVIGGPTYRGDSFICAAAIHAGALSNSAGGCAVARRSSDASAFHGSEENGIHSVSFDSSFPLAFEFQDGSSQSCNGADLQWAILAISLFFSITMSLLTTSPSLFFYSTFVIVFVQVGIVSDPPNDGSEPLASLFSILLGGLLPAIFCATVMYHACVKRSLEELEAHIDKTILWLGGCWFGALGNYTFEWIPISRLTSHDLKQQPGAIVALAAIVVVLLLIAIQQIHYFRLEGRLPRYLCIYGGLIAVIILALLLPGLNLRIHHYIIGLLLLPGTSIQTRPSLLYQGILVGLFINGIARWGFDSVLQTSAALRGDGQFESLLPIIADPIISLGEAVSNITFRLNVPDVKLRFDGVSFLVNDVERARVYFAEHIGEGVEISWARNIPGLQKAYEQLYFRFAYIQDRKSLDYTKAGLWSKDGSWRMMDPGPSK